MSDDAQHATNSAPKRKRGRPRKHIDLELVEKLAHIQCTYGEIAATLGVSVDTLQRNKEFAVIYKRGAEGGRKSLRRMQFEAANRGNVVMQIWLGKQYLGQSDHVKSEVQPLVPSVRHMTAEQMRQALAALVPAALGSALDADYTVVNPGRPAKPAGLLGASSGDRTRFDSDR